MRCSILSVLTLLNLTIHYFRQSISFSDVKHPHIDLQAVVVDLYIYGTGANPQDPDFEEKGGMFYIVAVWTGYFTPQDSPNTSYFKFKTYGSDEGFATYLDPDHVEPKMPTSRGPEPTLYQCIPFFSYVCPDI